MKDLFEALQNNGFAQDDEVTLGYVISNTMQDAQYGSQKAVENYKILLKYSEYVNIKISELKRRFLDPCLDQPV